MSSTRFPAQLQAFTLAGSGASPTDTTLLLSSFQDIDGNNVTMAELGTKAYGTIEPASGTQEEQISFTGVTQNGNGTASLTGVSHVAFLTPYTETSGLNKSHAGGVTFVISNTSGFYSDFANTKDDETITGEWTFPNDDSVRIRLAADTDTAVNSALVTLGQLGRTSFAGTVNGSTTIKGIYQSATIAQQGTATATGSTGARLLVENANLISSSTGSANASQIPILNSAGTLDDTFVAQSGTAGANINAGQAVRVGGDGKIYLTDPTNASLSQLYNSFVGVSLDTVLSGAAVRYVGSGRVAKGLPTFSSHDSSPVYLGNTAGSLSLTPGTQTIQIGWVLSDTTMLIISPVNKEVQDLVSQGYAAGTAGETISVGNALYVKASDGNLYNAQSNADEKTFSFVGIAQSAASAAGVVIYSRPGGIATGLSGLTAGSIYFLTDSAGVIGTSPGTRFAKIGQALSTTTLQVQQPKFIVSGTQSISSATTFAQTTGFYPARISCWCADSSGATLCSTNGDASNNCLAVAASTSYNPGVGTYAFYFQDGGGVTKGSITTLTATGFTLSCSGKASTAAPVVYWSAWSE